MVHQIRLFLPLGALALGIGACTQSLSEGTAVQLTEQRRAAAPDTSGYERRTPQDLNGIGKYYMGRQIAHVMGHEGAAWLDRSDRAREEDTDQLLRALKLKPTDVVADIGAGTGYFTFKMSALVPQGRVLAVDIQPEMLASLRETKAKLGARNVVPVRGTTQNPNLPAGQVDLVLLVDAYHEFDYPREMTRAIRQALSPTGRLALVEYRAEDPDVPIKRIHKMSVAQARREMAAVGLRLTDSVETLPQQHLLFFQK
ncbi:class I SAM-dependent methyltransferase [Hymenobacter psychrophilus]|uniref:Methyltransferase domain-containing protein n=1 Tax=Hymenobacter psychrophilus TaxID=651662 RepID=A0A1H3FSP8_9BACT|nr:class I SAM-dependent methyltransferase [Hymenobacter psychrophilus]SDX93174.1 Methyltransferase domain-containing protein [Hymenobacter psychrophilus]